MEWTDVLLRIGVAAALGIGLGLNRYLHRKSIGMRTLGLVAITSAGIVLAVSEASGPDGAARAVQGIITGIGFIGAGLIMHLPGEHAVHGITTATTVWVAAAVGIMCGLGVWHVLAPAAAIMGLLLTTGGHFEKAAARYFGKFEDKKEDHSEK